MRSVNASKVAGAGDAPGPAAAARAPSRRGVERFFTKEKLTLLAGATGYDRGCDYAQRLRVVKLRRWRGRIEATVEGREDYDVRLWDEGYRLGFSCSCPVGQRLQLCKHGVATALTWLRERQAFDRERPARRAVVRLADVRTHLMPIPHSACVQYGVLQLRRRRRLPRPAAHFPGAPLRGLPQGPANTGSSGS